MIYFELIQMKNANRKAKCYSILKKQQLFFVAGCKNLSRTSQQLLFQSPQRGPFLLVLGSLRAGGASTVATAKAGMGEAAKVTPNVVIVRESDPQNGRNIQVKDF